MLAGSKFDSSTEGYGIRDPNPAENKDEPEGGTGLELVLADIEREVTELWGLTS